MNDMKLEQAVKSLLVEACGSEQALEDRVDLLESELLDSLGLSPYWMDWRILASPFSQPR